MRRVAGPGREVGEVAEGRARDKIAARRQRLFAHDVVVEGDRLRFFAGVVQVTHERVAEVDPGQAREAAELGEHLRQPALPAPDLQQQLGEEDQSLAALVGLLTELEGGVRVVLGVVERALEDPARRTHHAHVKQQARLVELPGPLLGELHHRIGGVDVAGFHRGPAPVERGLKDDGRVTQRLGDREQLVALGDPLRERVGRVDREVAEQENVRERALVADAPGHRERVAAELKTTLTVFGPHELRGERREQLRKNSAVVGRLGLDRVLERVDELAIGPPDPGEESAVDREHRLRQSGAVVEIAGDAERPQQRLARIRLTRTQLGPAETQHQLVLVGPGHAGPVLRARTRARRGRGGRGSRRLRRPGR